MERELKHILESLNTIGDTMRREAEVCEAELKERLELGLQGDEAKKHYNDYMQRNGLPHLMTSN